MFIFVYATRWRETYILSHSKHNKKKQIVQKKLQIIHIETIECIFVPFEFT